MRLDKFAGDEREVVQNLGLLGDAFFVFTQLAVQALLVIEKEEFAFKDADAAGLHVVLVFLLLLNAAQPVSLFSELALFVVALGHFLNFDLVQVVFEQLARCKSVAEVHALPKLDGVLVH